MIDRLLNDPVTLARTLHVLASLVLLGFPLGTGWCAWQMRHARDAAMATSLLPQITRGELGVFSVTTLILIFTGLWMTRDQAVKLNAPWILWSVGGLVAAAFCWLFVLFCQLRGQAIAEVAAGFKKPLGRDFRRIIRLWFTFGTLGWFALLAAMVGMIVRAHRP